MSTPSDDTGTPRGTPLGGEAQRSRYRETDPWSEAGTSFTGDDLEYARRRRRRAGRDRKRGRLAGYVLVALFAFILGVGTGYARGYFSTGAVGRQVSIVISPGASLSTIARKLEAGGVVAHARAFVIRAESDGYGTKFKPGTYTLRENEPYGALVAALVRGQRPPTVKVSIPEGSTLQQCGEIVAGRVKGISQQEYVRVARDDPPTVRFAGYKVGTTLEGLLFPATYEVDPDVGARAFVKKQLDAFDTSFAQVDMSRARKANLTPYDVVIIASMIDREAQVPAERKLVAAVIWNRLRSDMLLQIDATIQYALGKTKPLLTYDDLEIDSLYNTYKHVGLPPTPISNPGVAALQAAADPAVVDYLYYVARADGTGRHYFSKSYEEFLANQERAASNGQ